MAFVYFIQYVNRVVGPHFRKDANRVVSVHVFQHIAGHLTIQFRQSFCGFIGRQVTQYAHLLGKAELL